MKKKKKILIYALIFLIFIALLSTFLLYNSKNNTYEDSIKDLYLNNNGNDIKDIPSQSDE
ncbi:MAG: hypothetical protein PHN31_03990 [Candidatus Gracilibacteria bacterium]|nr:hypothetical protein [Candidatus Gracilibacteria bacterium]